MELTVLQLTYLQDLLYNVKDIFSSILKSLHTDNVKIIRNTHRLLIGAFQDVSLESREKCLSWSQLFIKLQVCHRSRIRLPEFAGIQVIA